MICFISNQHRFFRSFFKHRPTIFTSKAWIWNCAFGWGAIRTSYGSIRWIFTVYLALLEVNLSTRFKFPKPQINIMFLNMNDIKVKEWKKINDMKENRIDVDWMELKKIKILGFGFRVVAVQSGLVISDYGVHEVGVTVCGVLWDFNTKLLLRRSVNFLTMKIRWEH